MKDRNITYSEVRTFTYENAIVRVYIPDLSDEERKQRMKTLHKAAEELLKGVHK